MLLFNGLGSESVAPRIPLLSIIGDNPLTVEWNRAHAVYPLAIPTGRRQPEGIIVDHPTPVSTVIVSDSTSNTPIACFLF